MTYYTEKLVFQVVSITPGRDYAIVERDDVAIHLFESLGLHSPTSVHVFAAGLDELHAELTQRNARVCQQIERRPWGNRDFRVLDDSDNEIKFTEPLAD